MGAKGMMCRSADSNPREGVIPEPPTVETNSDADSNPREGVIPACFFIGLTTPADSNPREGVIPRPHGIALRWPRDSNPREGGNTWSLAASRASGPGFKPREGVIP